MLLRLSFYNHREARATVCLAVVAFVILGLIFVQPVEDSPPVKATWGWHTTGPPPDPSTPRPSFADLLAHSNSHKVVGKSYHLLYEKYFPALRDKPTKLLEIGLGCEGFAAAQANESGTPKPPDISGVGSSYHTYIKYFSKLSLTYIEPDEDCARAFSSRHDKALVFTGDPTDEAFVDKFSHASTVHGLFDVVIHDGAASSDAAEERGLRDLWRVVKPGGVYFVEGIRGWHAGDEAGKRPFVTFFNGLVWEDLMLPNGEVSDIDCMKGICAFFKKA